MRSQVSDRLESVPVRWMKLAEPETPTESLDSGEILNVNELVVLLGVVDGAT